MELICFSTAHRSRFAAQEIQIGILAKQVGLGLWRVEAFAAHYEVTAKVISWRKKKATTNQNNDLNIDLICE